MNNEIEEIFDEFQYVENDVWQDAKEAIPIHLASGGHRVKRVAEYARHLEDENVNLKHKYSLVNSTISIATDRLNEVKAENESLKRRINELETDSFDIAKQESTDPVLETSRMMATAAEWLKGKKGHYFASTVVETYSGIAEPYRLRETGNK